MTHNFSYVKNKRDKKGEHYVLKNYEGEREKDKKRFNVFKSTSLNLDVFTLWRKYMIWICRKMTREITTWLKNVSPTVFGQDNNVEHKSPSFYLTTHSTTNISKRRNKYRRLEYELKGNVGMPHTMNVKTKILIYYITYVSRTV